MVVQDRKGLKDNGGSPLLFQTIILLHKKETKEKEVLLGVQVRKDHQGILASQVGMECLDFPESKEKKVFEVIQDKMVPMVDQDMTVLMEKKVSVLKVILVLPVHLVIPEVRVNLVVMG